MGERGAAVDDQIRNVSDTALWVAAYRAEEAARPNPAFRDPLVGLLSGERGRALMRATPGGGLLSWVMVIRTVAIDRLVLAAVARGVDLVVNLGAGLDTRPYRLALPAQLRWVEIDLPGMVAYKNAVLAAHAPVCQLERIGLDLSHVEPRRRTLREVVAGARKVAVLTEGVLPYLEPGDVEALARELHELEVVQYWMHDYYDGDARRDALRLWSDRLKAAPVRFRVTDWFGFFAERGWMVIDKIRLVDEAARLRRRPRVTFRQFVSYLLASPREQRARRDRAGYALLVRAG